MKYEMMGRRSFRTYNKILEFKHDSIFSGVICADFENRSINEIVDKMIKNGVKAEDMPKFTLKAISNDSNYSYISYKEFKSDRNLKIGDKILVTDPEDFECKIIDIQYNLLNDTIILYTDFIVSLDIDKNKELYMQDKIEKIKKAFIKKLNEQFSESNNKSVFKPLIKKFLNINEKVINGENNGFFKFHKQFNCNNKS